MLIHFGPYISAWHLGIYGYTMASCEAVTLGTYSKVEEVFFSTEDFVK